MTNEEAALISRIKVTDEKNRPYGIIGADYNPLGVALSITIASTPVVPDRREISPETIFRLRCLDSTVVDDFGNKYEVCRVKDKKDGEHSAVLYVKAAGKPASKKVDLDKIAKYTFDCMVTEGMINPDCKLGAVKDRIDACIKAAAYFSDADPETRPE